MVDAPDSTTAVLPTPTSTVLGACPHDCPDTCALVTTVQDGVAVKLQGNAAHSHTAGVLCTKVSRYIERNDHAERLVQPLKRSGPRAAAASNP
jgi:anaerobic selenocysteine-containing dehydrogenase